MADDVELVKFVSHVKSADCSKRVLVIEPTVSHQEVLPSLVYWFNALGFGVDVLGRTGQVENRKISPVFADSPADVNFFHAASESNSKYIAHVIEKSGYQYVYFNTLFADFIDAPRLNLCKLVAESGKTCFATLHNLEDYLEMKHLFPKISERNVFALGKSTASSANVSHITPCYFVDGVSPGFHDCDCVNFICIGEVKPIRRDYNQLIDACIALRDRGTARNIKVYVACQSISAEYYEVFQDNIARYGLGETITVVENLSFPDLFDLVKRMHFQLFLLNQKSSQNREYISGKITGGLNISLGFGLIPVVENIFAEAWGLSGCSVRYEGTPGLVEVMETIARAPDEFAHLKAKTLMEGSARLGRSIEVLRSGMGMSPWI